jgi:hypothetical protein
MEKMQKYWGKIKKKNLFFHLFMGIFVPCKEMEK